MIDYIPPGNGISGRRRLWVPLAIAVFTLVWVILAAAVSRALPGAEQLPPGTAVVVGGGAEVSGLDGWTIDTRATDLAQQLVLEKGDVTLVVSYHGFGQRASVDEAWQGFERVLDAATARDGGAVIGEPATFQVAGSAGAEASDLRLGDRVGEAFVVTADDGLRAVEGTVLAPLNTSSADLDAALAVVQSVAFSPDQESS
jgi:hypothetical protein